MEALDSLAGSGVFFIRETAGTGLSLKTLCLKKGPRKEARQWH
jgi:hypothetical protein